MIDCCVRQELTESPWPGGVVSQFVSILGDAGHLLMSLHINRRGGSNCPWLSRGVPVTLGSYLIDSSQKWCQ